MQRQPIQSIGEALMDYLRDVGLEQPLLEHKIVELWPVVMGTSVAQLTRKVEVKNGVLFVHISSAALKAQLFELRHELVSKMNDAVGGGQIIHDVRLLG